MGERASAHAPAMSAAVASEGRCQPFHHDGYAHEGRGPRPAETMRRGRGTIGGDDDGGRERYGDGRVAGRQGVDDAGGHAEVGPGEDVVLENLRWLRHRAEGSSRKGGSTPRLPRDGDEDTGCRPGQARTQGRDEGGEFSYRLAAERMVPSMRIVSDYLSVRGASHAIANECVSERRAVTPDTRRASLFICRR